MLDPQSTWTDKIKNLAPAKSAHDGNKAFAAAVGGLMNNVQAGPTGTPGIFTFAEAIMTAQMDALLMPTKGPSWAMNLATCWMTACGLSVITPGTVTLPVWTASTVDTLTLPTGLLTIATLSVANELLTAGLLEVAMTFQNPNSSVDDFKKGPENIAKAFRNATSAFVFTCIGLVIPAVPTPVPIPAM